MDAASWNGLSIDVPNVVAEKKKKKDGVLSA